MKKKKAKLLPTSIKPFVFNRCTELRFARFLSVESLTAVVEKFIRKETGKMLSKFLTTEDISSFTSFQTIVKPYECMYSVYLVEQ